MKQQGLPAPSHAAQAGDIAAGLAVAGLMLPEAVAYAGIAGLPPTQGVLAALAGGLGYLAVGRSRIAIVAPTSSSAALLAAAIGSMAVPAAARPGVAIAAAALTGLVFLGLALLRLGGLADFIARPVLHGFGFGLAITIVIRQLPALTGVGAAGDTVWAVLANWAGAAGALAPASALLGLAALVALLAMRPTRLPGPLLVLAAGMVLSGLLPQVARVGAVQLALSMPQLPGLSREQWFELARAVLPLALILFAESWGTIAGLAGEDELRPGRELAGLGAGNLMAALAGGMPVGAGFSAGNANAAAGAGSRVAGLAAVTGLGLGILMAGPLVARIPVPLLAAVVIAAVSHALDPRPLLRLRRLDRDFGLAMAAAAGVLAAGVLNGMLIAIALSLASLLRRLARPRLAELGRLGTHDYVDRAAHADAAAEPGLAILRPAAPLFFANAGRLTDAIAAKAAARPPGTVVILSLEESDDLDSSALDALDRLAERLQRRGQKLLLARVHDPVRALLDRAGLARLVPAETYSVADAVAAARRMA